jgi:hypothetical protein
LPFLLTGTIITTPSKASGVEEVGLEEAILGEPAVAAGAALVNTGKPLESLV